MAKKAKPSRSIPNGFTKLNPNPNVLYIEPTEVGVYLLMYELQLSCLLTP